MIEIGGNQVTYDYQCDVTFTPVVKHGMVGFRVEKKEGGRPWFIYMKPSTDGSGAPEHMPNVFIYEGPDFDPGKGDVPLHYYDIEVEEVEDERTSDS